MDAVRARHIPSIDFLRQRADARQLEVAFGRHLVVDALRAEAATLRERLTGARAADRDTPDALADVIVAGAAQRLSALVSPRLQPVINATGVVIHTNLGRAPLAASAIDRLTQIAPRYSTLEFDLSTGGRGKRDVHAESLLCRLTRAEAAVVVNNNAAAALLVLSALAAGREVIISRGELVEIGGGFRVPDVLRQSGAVLREVGTTNRTRIADYAAAISDRTALILRVHPSNFTIEGFTERASLDELAALGARFKIPVIEDLGSGFMEPDSGDAADPRRDVRSAPLVTEPHVQASIRAGLDVVLFSGDKLLGGPQAGIIVGRAALLKTIRTHPLMRALRVDKLTYAALDATLIEHLRGRAHETVPILRMLHLTPGDLEARALAVADALRGRSGWRTSIVDGESAIGGGSAPGARLPTRLLALERDGLSGHALLERLRLGTPPVIGRIDADRVVLDFRTIAPDEDALLRDALARC